MDELIMKTLAMFVVFSSLGLATPGDSSSIAARPEDVSSPDAIIGALYNVISGPVGQKRDFDRMRTLFMPGALMVATGFRPNGDFVQRKMTVDEYIAGNEKLLVEAGFTEKEIGRTSEQFGTIMHAFSAYEAHLTGRDGKPATLRGINTIQLMSDGKRWWIVSVLWQAETKEVKIPERYLEKR